MADKPLFTLDADARWRLAHDPLQWIVQRRHRALSRSKGCGGRNSAWKGADYIGSEKRILRRCIAERGITLTPEAQARLDALPERFMDFIAAPERFSARPETEAA